MAEKKKAISSDDRLLESDRQFLERTLIGNHLKDALKKIIANRPEDPITFLIDYFDNVEEETNVIDKAYNVLTTAHHSRLVFEKNVRAAYQILSKYKIKKNLRGINGSIYKDLLLKLTKNFPQQVATGLLKKIECTEFEAVPYSIFRSGIFTTFVLQDYIELSSMLFSSLDLESSGKTDKVLCEAVLNQLGEALSQSHKDPQRIMESGYSVGPDRIHDALERVLTNEVAKGGKLTTDQFVLRAAQFFLNKVQPIH